MSCKSALYASNTSNQPFVASGTVLNFGSIVRRFGSNCTLSGGNVQIEGQGYYDVDTNITFTPTTAGTATIQLYKDGVAVTGAEATITTVVGDIYTVSIPAIIRETCCCESTITVVIGGVSGSANNASITVEKI